jgi:hypothetical protein
VTEPSWAAEARAAGWTPPGSESLASLRRGLDAVKATADGNRRLLGQTVLALREVVNAFADRLDQMDEQLGREPRQVPAGQDAPPVA